MVNCCVPQCTNYSSKTKGQGISYHRIPTDPELQRSWIARIRRQNLPALKNCYVCSAHFTSDCFELRAQIIGEPSFRRLKENVIPSIFSFKKPSPTKRRASEDRVQRKKHREVSNIMTLSG